MNTTVTLRPARPSADQALSGLKQMGTTLRQRLVQAFAPSTDIRAQELLELARSYEATQPSFAADLRAAAGRAADGDAGRA